MYYITTLANEILFPTTSTAHESPTPPEITVLPPGEDDDDEDEEDYSVQKWFTNHKVTAAIIFTSIFLLLVVLLISCIRRMRKRALKKEEESKTEADTDRERSQIPSRHSSRNPSARPDIFSESFVIIRSPEFARQQYKRDLKARRRTIAVHPLYPAGGPRKSIPHIHDRRPTVVGFARMSNAGLEIHSSSEENLDSDAPQESQPKVGHSSGRRASAFITMDSADTVNEVMEPGVGGRSRANSLAVPVLQYRRISQGTHHAVYAPTLAKQRNSNSASK